MKKKPDRKKYHKKQLENMNLITIEYYCRSDLSLAHSCNTFNAGTAKHEKKSNATALTRAPNNSKILAKDIVEHSIT